MKELEVNAMLADPNIPDQYKLGGRLDDRFLDGVEYAERAMEKAPTLWLARDRDEDGRIGDLSLYSGKPSRLKSCFIANNGFYVDLPRHMFPDLSFEDGPKKLKLIIEDE
jgi:hypothetical protein